MIILTGSKTTRRADWRVVVPCLIWILAAPLTAVADDPPKTGDAAAVAAAFKAIELAQPKTARSAIAKIEAPLLRKALTWFMMRDLDAAGDTLEISAFLRENPTWPDRRRLRRQAERAIPANWTATAVKAWFDGSEPVSDLGRARLGDALADQSTLEPFVFDPASVGSSTPPALTPRQRVSSLTAMPPRVLAGLAGVATLMTFFATFAILPARSSALTSIAPHVARWMHDAWCTTDAPPPAVAKSVCRLR